MQILYLDFLFCFVLHFQGDIQKEKEESQVLELASIELTTDENNRSIG